VSQAVAVAEEEVLGEIDSHQKLAVPEATAELNAQLSLMSRTDCHE
jgi:uncharacterized lipoprotein YbaY